MTSHPDLASEFDLSVVEIRYAAYPRTGVRIDTGIERFECVDLVDGSRLFRLWTRHEGRWTPGQWRRGPQKTRINVTGNSPFVRGGR